LFIGWFGRRLSKIFAIFVISPSKQRRCGKNKQIWGQINHFGLNRPTIQGQIVVVPARIDFADADRFGQNNFDFSAISATNP
jgi:hypothetical protein